MLANIGFVLRDRTGRPLFEGLYEELVRNGFMQVDECVLSVQNANRRDCERFGLTPTLHRGYVFNRGLLEMLDSVAPPKYFYIKNRPGLYFQSRSHSNQGGRFGKIARCRTTCTCMLQSTHSW